MKIIAGPCQHESYEQSLDIAAHCKDICDAYDIDYVFKASFDKANRTAVGSKRGIGLDNTLGDFRRIKEELEDVLTLTDVHDVHQVYEIVNHYNDAVDVLQIPAFLSRQTDLIDAACSTDKIVNIKKGQFMAPWDVQACCPRLLMPPTRSGLQREEQVLDIILWLLTLLVSGIFLIILLHALLWIARMLFSALVVMVLVAAAIVIMHLIWPTPPLLWV